MTFHKYVFEKEEEKGGDQTAVKGGLQCQHLPGQPVEREGGRGDPGAGGGRYRTELCIGSA